MTLNQRTYISPRLSTQQPLTLGHACSPSRNCLGTYQSLQSGVASIMGGYALRTTAGNVIIHGGDFYGGSIKDQLLLQETFNRIDDRGKYINDLASY